MIKVHSPYDGQLLGNLERTSADQAMAILSRAFDLVSNRKKTIPLHERITILEKAIEKTLNKKDELIKTACLEGGKPFKDTVVEIERGIQGIKLAVSELRTQAGHAIPMGLTASSSNRLAFTIKEPVGVVFAISAFNHPFNLIVHQVIPAIAMGNAVIVKPASQTPLSCRNLLEILYDSGLPKDWARMILTDHETTEKIVADRRISYLSFIGSSKVGWSLKSKLPPGAGCSLEHGGAAPVIIESDVDLEKVVPLMAHGGFYHAGQVCVSVQRVFVHKNIEKEFLKRLSEFALTLKVGDPLDPKTDIGPLIHENEVARVKQWIDEAVKMGGKLICGGEILPNHCLSATVIYNPPAEASVSKHEVFGPVIVVYPFSSRDEAIQQANSLPFSFQASVFTQNIDAAFDCVEKLKATTVLVNDHTAFRVDNMPFGGREESGLGVGGIPYTMKEMSFEKLVLIRKA